MCHISLLPDEILLKIFQFFDVLHPSGCRTEIPLVCKRWRSIVFDSRGVLFHTIKLNFIDNLEWDLAACVAWMQRHLASGCLTSPLHLIASDWREGDDKYPTSEEFAILLGCYGDKLVTLSLLSCHTLFMSGSFPAFWALTNLTSLNLNSWGAKIDADDFERGMRYLRKLQDFSITSMLGEDEEQDAESQWGLQCFPRVLCSLTTLESLYFSNQQLGRIPQEISQLTQLSSLTIRGGCGLELRVCYLPTVLAKLPALSQLTVSGKLTSLEMPWDAVTHAQHVLELTNWLCLSKLRMLTLKPSTCCLGDESPSLPLEVALMTSLEELTLLEFHSKEEDPDLSALKELKKLEIYAAELERFPGWTADIPGLQHLKVTGTSKDWTIPAGFANLQNLTMAYCNLKKVSDSFGGLTPLTRLELTECKVARISPCISKLTRLRELNLRDNFLYPEVPAELAALTWLHFLHLRLNRARKTKNVKCRKDGNGGLMVPKMAVTEDRLRWLLQCPNVQQVHLDVTREERDKLRKFRRELRSTVGRPVLVLNLCWQYS